MPQYNVICTNCGLEIGEPAAQGNRCPRCSNGAMVPEGGDML